jgi:tRNA threonylcarbamoyl adenosine modification protein (Sua5/YciO/YrdC/YwlC family)
LANKFWPGPLTLVLDAGGEFVGFRVPAHEVALELLKKMGTVLCVTSANRSGEPPALNASDAARALGSSVALILDAGPAIGRVPSTVVKIKGAHVEILREGAIPKNDILGAIRK